MGGLRNTSPQIPGFAVEIPDKWEPDDRLKQNKTVRTVDVKELPQLIIDFRTFCKDRGLKRARWGHLFVTWITHRHDPAWSPNVETM